MAESPHDMREIRQNTKINWLCNTQQQPLPMGLKMPSNKLVSPFHFHRFCRSTTCALVGFFSPVLFFHRCCFFALFPLFCICCAFLCLSVVFSVIIRMLYLVSFPRLIRSLFSRLFVNGFAVRTVDVESKSLPVSSLVPKSDEPSVRREFSQLSFGKCSFFCSFSTRNLH